VISLKVLAFIFFYSQNEKGKGDGMFLADFLMGLLPKLLGQPLYFHVSCLFGDLFEGTIFAILFVAKGQA